MAQSIRQFSYHRHADQARPPNDAAHHPVVVVGAGPVGLAFQLAIDLAQRGQSVVLLDDADRIGDGSRAICFSKRSLEYWDRLGVGQRMIDKGVVWKSARSFTASLSCTSSTSCPTEATRGRPSSTCSNITPRRISSTACRNCRN